MTASLWEQLTRQWPRLGPPLRPCAEDLATAQAAVDEWALRSRGASAAATALIFGVTPELRQLRWPVGTRVIAADRSTAMIRSIGATCSFVVQADWCRLPLANGTCDLAFGDASFTQLNVEQAAQVMREAARVLRPGGMLVTRVFVRPDVDESPDEAWEELFAGRVGSFHAFKLRLLASLHDGEGHVKIADAWAYFAKRCACPQALADQLGWPVEHIQTIDAYRGQSTTYWLPTIGEFREVAEWAFEELACSVPRYEVGARCPTFVLRVRPTAKTVTSHRVRSRHGGIRTVPWKTYST